MRDEYKRKQARYDIITKSEVELYEMKQKGIHDPARESMVVERMKVQIEELYKEKMGNEYNEKLWKQQYEGNFKGVGVEVTPIQRAIQSIRQLCDVDLRVDLRAEYTAYGFGCWIYNLTTKQYFKREEGWVDEVYDEDFHGRIPTHLNEKAIRIFEELFPCDKFTAVLP